MSIATAGNDSDDDLKEELEEKQWQHKGMAAQSQQNIKDFVNNDDNNVRGICIDFQQTLPLPRLSTSVAYYKRKLWVYNLCIHNIKTNTSKFYVWDEATGGRGSDEIASCIKLWIDEKLEIQWPGRFQWQLQRPEQEH